MEKQFTIDKFQLEVIADALRLTANIYGCRNQVTCFDRQVTQAEQFAKNILNGEKDKYVNYMAKPPKLEYSTLQKLFEKMISNENKVYVSGKTLIEYFTDLYGDELPSLPYPYNRIVDKIDGEEVFYTLELINVGVEYCTVYFTEPISSEGDYLHDFEIKNLIIDEPKGKVWHT